MSLINKLKEYFNKQEQIQFAYLFGSVATGKEGKLSDIDIAVFLDEKLKRNEMAELQMKIIGDLIDLLKTDKIDVVILNDAPLLLKFNVIKTGKILKDSKKRIFFESKIMSEYLDQKYYTERHFKLAVERIAEKGII